MQGGLSPTDRKLLGGTAGIAFVLIVLTSVFAPPSHGDGSQAPSTYSSASGGAEAAYLLLEELHYPVRRWEEPPSRLLEVSHRAVLIIASPTQMPSPGERASLLKFVRVGGRILFCGDSVKSFFPQAAVTESTGGEEWAELHADLPSPFTRGAPRITMEPRSAWKPLGARQLALYGDANAPLVVISRIGRGELLWWSAPTPLTNAGLARTGNLNVFLDAVSGPRTETPLQVYWDEYFHGVQSSLWSYVEKTPVKWTLVQALLIFGVALFSFSRRWGPIAFPLPVSRLSPLEFVDTLGGLYERAGASSVATSVAYRQLRLSLIRRLSLSPGISDMALARAAEQRLGWNQRQLAATLEKAVVAQNHNPRPSEALKLVQEIGAHIALLANKPRKRESN